MASVKKPKNVTSPCAISPVLLECPEQDCSKKYKHANGLKYHQSHAHGIISNADDDSLTAPDSPSQRSQSPPPNPRSGDKSSMETNFSQKLNFEATKTTATSSDLKVNSFLGTTGTVEPPTPVKLLTSPVVPSTERPVACTNNENSLPNDPNPFAEAILKPGNPGISTTSTPTKQDAQSSKSELFVHAT